MVKCQHFTESQNFSHGYLTDFYGYRQLGLQKMVFLAIFIGLRNSYFPVDRLFGWFVNVRACQVQRCHEFIGRYIHHDIYKYVVFVVMVYSTTRTTYTCMLSGAVLCWPKGMRDHRDIRCGSITVHEFGMVLRD